jgi:adenylate cyclase
MTEERLQRRLAAILAADVVGYSRLMESDEAGTLSALKVRRKDLLEPTFSRYQGRIFKVTGDGVLVEFGSAVNAVQCAIDLQHAMAAANSDVPEQRRILLRIGINLGDVIVEGSDLFGEGVNVAARLEGLAEPGGVAIADTVNENVRGRVGIELVDCGLHEVKNIKRPVHVWGWSPSGSVRALVKPAMDAPALPDKPSIAVMPFDNMSGDPEQGYFADGITEDIITDLSKVSGLFVIARNSSFAYRGQAADVRQVSRELGVRYILEGSVRRAANRVRINVQMIDGSTGGHLWAERFDRALEDIFAVQDEVTRTIVAALKVRLTAGEEARRRVHGKVLPEAYDLHARAGEKLREFSPDGMRQAGELLRRAMELDPQFANAPALLSVSMSVGYANRWADPDTDRLKAALQLAQKAIQLDANEPQGHHALAMALMWLKRLDEAEEAADRLIALDPNYPFGYNVMGNIQDYKGNYERAVELFSSALRLDPHFNLTLHMRGRALFGLGRYDEAEQDFRRRLSLAPRSDMTRFYLASLCGHTNRYEEARRLWQEMMEINPAFSVEHLRKMVPYRDPAWFERFTDGIRKAGIAV